MMEASSDHGFLSASYEIFLKCQLKCEILVGTVGCPKSGEAAIIDCGDAAAALKSAQSHGIPIRHLLQTHAHIDHIQGIFEVSFISPQICHDADTSDREIHWQD